MQIRKDLHDVWKKCPASQLAVMFLCFCETAKNIRNSFPILSVVCVV